MISENIAIVDIDASHWNNLFRLARGEFFPARKSRQNKRTRLVLVWKGDKCLKAIHSEKGVIRDFAFLGMDKLEEMARRESVDAILAVEYGTPRRLMHRVQSALSLNGNIVRQGFDIYEKVGDEFAARGFHRYPALKLRDIKYGSIAAIVKMILPADELIVFCIYSDDGAVRDLSGLPIVTSGIHRMNREGELDLYTTTDSLIPAGLRIADWREDYKEVNRLAEKVWGSQVFVGFHIPLSAVAELGGVPSRKIAGTLMDIDKQKKVIIEPFPLRLKMALKMGSLGGKR